MNEVPRKTFVVSRFRPMAAFVVVIVLGLLVIGMWTTSRRTKLASEVHGKGRKTAALVLQRISGKGVTAVHRNGGVISGIQTIVDEQGSLAAWLCKSDGSVLVRAGQVTPTLEALAMDAFAATAAVREASDVLLFREPQGPFVVVVAENLLSARKAWRPIRNIAIGLAIFVVVFAAVVAIALARSGSGRRSNLTGPPDR